MAAGIIEKSNSGLFENEVEFNGKYANIVRYLRDELGVFTTFREAYVLSSIIGFVNNKKIIDDTIENVKPASIFPNELSKRKQDLRFIYRVMMVNEDNPDFTIEDYTNRAFRDDSDDNKDKLKQNMMVFNSYACGGLEYLQEIFVDLDKNKTDEIVNVLYEMLHKFAIEVELLENDELPDVEVED